MRPRFSEEGRRRVLRSAGIELMTPEQHKKAMVAVKRYDREKREEWKQAKRDYGDPLGLRGIAITNAVLFVGILVYLIAFGK